MGSNFVPFPRAGSGRPGQHLPYRATQETAMRG